MKIKERWVAWEEMLPGFTHAIDFQKVGGLQPGSIPFAGTTGFLTQDNAALFWDETNKILKVDGAVVINESGEDKDFRVEGLNNTTLLNTDAANDYVGFLGIPSCDVHLNKAAASACFRVSANTQPWIQWEERNYNRGFAIGVPPSGKKLYIDYDSPIGTYQTIMMTFDAATNRVGVFDNTPSYTFDVNGEGRFDDLYLNDTDASHVVLLHWNENEASADRILNFTLSGGDRIFALHGDLTVEAASLINQDLTTDARVAFAGIDSSSYIKLSNNNELRFYDNGNYVGFEAPDLTGNQIWVLPDEDGGAGEAIITDGAGNLSFAFVDHDLLTNTHDNPYKLDDLAAPDDNTDLDFSTLLHGLVPKGTNVGNFLKDDGTWAAGGGGESNTASNQGSGVSVYFQKAGVDLQFNAIKSESNKLAVALDGATHDVELTLVEANIDHDLLTNTHDNPYKLDDLAVPDDNTDLDFSTLLHGLVPKGTNVGHFLKDDGTWAAGGGGGAVIFTDLTDTPANYVGAGDKIVKVNAAPDGLEFGADIENLENVDTLVDQGGKLPKVKAAGAGIEFGADIEDLEDVDTLTGQAGKYARVKVGDAGIEWAGAGIDYLDLFEDASIHWSWRTHNTDANRTIVEAANKLTIAIAPGTSYNWWNTMNDAPKIFTGIGRPPCEIITKLITITTNNETRAGIFVASNPIGIGADYAMMVSRRTVGGVESLQVNRLGTVYTAYAGAPYDTLPIWLKIRITADIRYGNHLRFYFSVNGIDWTEMGDPAGGYSDLLTSDGFVVGLFAQNWSALALSAEFDFFTVVPCLGADG